MNSKGEWVPLRLSFMDIKKAYFNGIPERKVFIRLPVEMGLPSNVVARQTRCVYGTRDAGMIWEETYRIALENCGFVTGAANLMKVSICTHSSWKQCSRSRSEDGSA